jgi:hypothetical protein
MPRDYRAIPLSALPDPVDERDLLKVAPPVELPPAASVDYRPKIKNQFIQNSCTGYASSWMWEQILVSRGMMPMTLSPTYPWYFARKLTNTHHQDVGVTSRDIMKALNHHGDCLLENWPADRHYAQEPDKLAQTYGEALKLPEYRRCESARDIMYSVAFEKQSVCLGLPITDAWYLPQVVETGVIPHGADLDRPLGGHMIVVMGYNDNLHDGCFIAANSWGEEWGDSGYVYLPYAYLGFTSWDAWTAGYEALPDPQS